MKRGSAVVVVILLILISSVAVVGMKYSSSTSAASVISINGAMTSVTGAVPVYCNDDGTDSTTGVCSAECGADLYCNNTEPKNYLPSCKFIGNTGLYDYCDATCKAVEIGTCVWWIYGTEVMCTSSMSCAGKVPGTCVGNKICSVTDCTETSEGIPAEVCNDGKDNDCDGSTDCSDSDCASDIACENACTNISETRVCGTDIGECSKGTQTCTADRTWGDCIGEVKPAAETCNDLDDDCSGTADDNMQALPANKQEGICKDSVKICYGASGWREPDYTAITNYEADENTCDGSDNDCDGEIDEGFSKETFYKDSDGDSYGIPTETTQACAASAGYTDNSMDCDDTKSSVNPDAIENCIDHVDNNCNNLTDGASEGCSLEEQPLEDQILPSPEAGNGICEAGESQRTTPIDCGCPAGSELVGTECKNSIVIQEEERAAVCGNNIAEGTEVCDGSSDAQCPGACDTDCKCKFEIGDSICSKDAGENSENSSADCAFKYSGVVILLAVLFAVIGGGAGYWYFRMGPGSQSFETELPNMKSPENVSSKQDKIDTIETYIRKTTALGYTPKEIRAALVNKGWDVDIVDERLASLTSEEEPE